MYCQIWIFIFETDQVKINSAQCEQSLTSAASHTWLDNDIQYLSLHDVCSIYQECSLPTEGGLHADLLDNWEIKYEAEWPL